MMQEYNNYANKQLEKLSKSQDKFIAKFDTKSYSSWFYVDEPVKVNHVRRMKVSIAN